MALLVKLTLQQCILQYDDEANSLMKSMRFPFQICSQTAKKLNEICPEYALVANGMAFCCDEKLIDRMLVNWPFNDDYTSPEMKCPVCRYNLQRLYCHLYCHVNQAAFLRVPGENNTKVDQIETYIGTEYANDLVNSCKWASSQQSTNMDNQQFFNQGPMKWSFGKDLSMNYVLLADETVTPEHDHSDDEEEEEVYFPLKDHGFKCNESIPHANIEACSCDICKSAC